MRFKISILILVVIAGVNQKVFSQNIVWEHCFGGTDYEAPLSIKETREGGSISGGYTHSTDYNASGNHGNVDGFVVRTDSLGNVLWTKCYGGSDFDEITDILVANDGGFYLAGSTQSIDGDVTFNHGGADVWVLKIDSLGSIIWQKTYGGSNFDGINSASLGSAGNLFLTGTSYSNDGDMNGNHGNADFALLVIDSLGNLLWTKSFGGSGEDDGKVVLPASDGSIFIGGTSGSYDGQVTQPHGGGDYWVLHLTQTGNIIWEHSYGGNSADVLGSMCTRNGQTLAMMGSTLSTNGDVWQFPDSSQNYWAVELDTTGSIHFSRAYGGSGQDEVELQTFCKVFISLITLHFLSC